MSERERKTILIGYITVMYDGSAHGKLTAHIELTVKLTCNLKYKQDQ